MKRIKGICGHGALSSYLIVLERAYFSSKLSVVKLENLEFEHTSSCSFIHFSSLGSSLEIGFTQFGPDTLNTYFKFY